MKHIIPFFPGEYITSIIYNRAKTSPYEESLFFELAKLCNLIDAFADTTQPKKLTFHIPDYDYVLFGIKLYLDGRITYKALDEFIGHIFFKKEQYIKRITALCQKHGINVTTTSPFVNLFGYNIDSNTKDLTKVIFEILGLAAPESISVPFKNNKETTEHQFIIKCLQKLMTNESNPTHRQVWFDFMKAHAKSFALNYLQEFTRCTLKTEPNMKILTLAKADENTYTLADILTISSVSMTTLEDILKIANPIVIGIASRGQPANKTCAAYPLSEGIIPRTYTQLSKKDSLKNQYPPIFTITTLDPLFCYSEATKGSAFYMDLAEESLSALITEEHILQHASSNIHRAICGQAPIPILSFINNDYSPRTPSPEPSSSSPESSSLNTKFFSSTAKIISRYGEIKSKSKESDIPALHTSSSIASTSASPTPSPSSNTFNTDYLSDAQASVDKRKALVEKASCADSDRYSEPQAKP